MKKLLIIALLIIGCAKYEQAPSSLVENGMIVERRFNTQTGDYEWYYVPHSEWVNPTEWRVRFERDKKK